MLMNAIKPFADKALGVVDKMVEDKDQANQIKREISLEMASLSKKELEAAADVLTTEIKQGGLSAKWRPHLMYLLMFIIAFNAVVVPIFAGFGVHVPVADTLSALPSALWQLLTISVGGYIGGRSLEKVAKNINFKEK